MKSSSFILLILCTTFMCTRSVNAQVSLPSNLDAGNLERQYEAMGAKGYAAFEKYYREIWGYRISDSSPQLDAPFVKVPTLVVQVRKDKFTYAEEDVQAIYDAIPGNDKELHWIEGTVQRFKGYTYFSEKPGLMLDWYNTHSVSSSNT